MPLSHTGSSGAGPTNIFSAHSNSKYYYGKIFLPRPLFKTMRRDGLLEFPAASPDIFTWFSCTHRWGNLQNSNLGALFFKLTRYLQKIHVLGEREHFKCCQKILRFFQKYFLRYRIIFTPLGFFLVFLSVLYSFLSPENLARELKTIIILLSLKNRSVNFPNFLHIFIIWVFRKWPTYLIIIPSIVLVKKLSFVIMKGQKISRFKPRTGRMGIVQYNCQSNRENVAILNIYSCFVNCPIKRQKNIQIAVYLPSEITENWNLSREMAPPARRQNF